MRIAPKLIPIVVVLACSSTPAFAAIKASDSSATHVYLQALLAKQRASTAIMPAALNATAMLEAQVKAECPNVLAGAPARVKGEANNQSEFEVSEELLSAGVDPLEQAERPVLTRFAGIVRKLRWSNRKLTRLLRSLAKEEAEQSAIAAPNLCADLKFWVASNYANTSPGTKAYLHRLNVVASTTLIEPEAGEPAGEGLFNLTGLVERRLKPYENRADRSLARKALPREVKLTDPRLSPLLEAIGRVFVALGQTPPAQ